MVKINEVTVLKEIAFVPALFWALAAAGVSMSAAKAYEYYSAWYDGNITDEELKKGLGVQAAETILSFGAVAGVAKGAKLSWRAFKSAWKKAPRKEPPLKTPKPIDKSFDRDQPLSKFGTTGEKDPRGIRYNPTTGRTDPPLTRGGKR